MALSLIQIIQRVAPRLGFRAPTIALTSTDLNVQILVSLAQEEGDSLMGGDSPHDWQQLTIEYTVPALAAQQQSAFPSDHERFAERGEIWNRSLNLKYLGPTQLQVWDELKSGQVSAGYVGWWRIIAGRLQLFPTPTAGNTLSWEYISNNWAQSAGGTPQPGFLLDSDQPRLPDKLFVAGIRWRYKAMRGLDYAEDMKTYERMREFITSNDRGLGVIRKSAALKRRDVFPTPTWPGTIIG